MRFADRLVLFRDEVEAFAEALKVVKGRVADEAAAEPEKVV